MIFLPRAHDEFTKAIALYPRFPVVLFDDRRALAHLRRDAEAKADFEKFVAMTPEGDFQRYRALQFIRKPELARANLAPEFGIVTPDGQRVTLADLSGKVVLVYFWATQREVCLTKGLTALATDRKEVREPALRDLEHQR
jgi:hypothetical protein